MTAPGFAAGEAGGEDEGTITWGAVGFVATGTGEGGAAVDGA